MATQEDLYCALCLVISDRANQVEWTRFADDDWSAFSSLAIAQGVAPIVYWTFRSAGWPLEIPGAIRTDLEQSYYASVAQNALLLGELNRLLAAFSQAGIPVLVMKGAVLATELYPDVALRPMNDLDLLIPRQQLELAIRVLQSCGYCIKKLIYDISFMGGPQQNVTVELHWGLIGENGWRSPVIDWFWRRSEVWRLARRDRQIDDRASRLCAADHLLFLAAHLMLGHPGMLSRLIWYYDLHLLISRSGQDLDWAYLLQYSLQIGWAQALYHALRGVQEYFGTPLPPGFLEALSAHDDQITQPMLSEEEMERVYQRWLWLAFRSLAGRMRLKLMLSLLFPEPDYMRQRYKPRPAWLWPLCYIVRWWNMLRAGSSILWEMTMTK